MPESEKMKTPEEEKFEAFKNDYLEVLKDPNLPDTLKVLLRHKDLLMVLGKIKPLTEVFFLKDIVEAWEDQGLWQEGYLDKFHKVLQDKFKLGIADERIVGKESSFRVFDAEQIKQQIKKFPDLLPWDDEENDLQAWWDANLQAGKKWDYILGVCEGFPKSAIDFYLKSGSTLMDIEHQPISSYWEDYGVPPGELAPDVVAREQTKKNFFDQFDNDQEIQAELKKTDNSKDRILQINQEVTRKLDEKDERLKK